MYAFVRHRKSVVEERMKVQAEKRVECMMRVLWEASLETV